MKKGAKIGIIIGAIILVILLCAGITYLQFRGVEKTLMDETILEELFKIKNKDCSGLETIEAKINEGKNKIISYCWNPLLKTLVQEIVGGEEKKNICKSENNPLDSILDEIKEACANF